MLVSQAGFPMPVHIDIARIGAGGSQRLQIGKAVDPHRVPVAGTDRVAERVTPIDCPAAELGDQIDESVGIQAIRFAARHTMRCFGRPCGIIRLFLEFQQVDNGDGATAIGREQRLDLLVRGIDSVSHAAFSSCQPGCSSPSAMAANMSRNSASDGAWFE